MYDDRTFVRSHPVKVSLSVYEYDLIKAAAAYQRKPPSAYVREMVMEEVLRRLHAEQSASAEQGVQTGTGE